MSPFVDFTSKTPSPISRTDISKVPPPRSKTAIFSSAFLSRPYASEAAVGSFIILITLRPAILPASFVACLWLSSKYAGTVITASVTGSPRYSSAASLMFARIWEDTSAGLYCLSLIFRLTSPLEACTIIYGRIDKSFCTSGDENFLPISLLTPYTVFSGFVIACRLAICPTSLSPPSVIATIDGVVRPPSTLLMTFGSPASMIATHEFVVPRSIPIILPIIIPPDYIKLNYLLLLYLKLFIPLLYHPESGMFSELKPRPLRALQACRGAGSPSETH